MPLIFQPFNQILAEIDQNLDQLYLFGDNNARRGTGPKSGQAIIRGKPNAIGVRTKNFPNNEPKSFWSDDKYLLYMTMIANDLAKARDYIRAGGTVVCPAEGLGTGRARLKQKAPRVFAYLQSVLYLLSKVHNELPTDKQASG